MRSRPGWRVWPVGSAGHLHRRYPWRGRRRRARSSIAASLEFSTPGGCSTSTAARSHGPTSGATSGHPALKLAELEKRPPYALRHTFAYWSLRPACRSRPSPMRWATKRRADVPGLRRLVRRDEPGRCGAQRFLGGAHHECTRRRGNPVAKRKLSRPCSSSSSGWSSCAVSGGRTRNYHRLSGRGGCAGLHSVPPASASLCSSADSSSAMAASPLRAASSPRSKPSSSD